MQNTLTVNAAVVAKIAQLWDPKTFCTANITVEGVDYTITHCDEFDTPTVCVQTDEQYALVTV